MGKLRSLNMAEDKAQNSAQGSENFTYENGKYIYAPAGLGRVPGAESAVACGIDELRDLFNEL
jgi:hypothetical protein